jgi:cephalosporin-C deacetylase-like acetyl esterase
MMPISPFVLLLAVLLFAAIALAQPPLPEVPADYFAEPADLPYDIQVIETKQEEGWRWTEFLYTSLIYKGQPVRVHAVYAVPDGVDAAHRAPAIIATHGADTGTRGTAGSWYWPVIRTFAKAGFCTLFYDWDYKPAPGYDPTKPDVPRRFTHYGALNFMKTGYWSKENDFKDSLHYQVMLAAKRGVSWLLAQPEVDAANLGAFGSSYGGIFSSMLFGIDPRVKAVNPEVYTSDFGLKEEAYNMLPGGWTEADAQAWKARFDSYLSLAKRKGPILYTVGANDPTFRLTKAMHIFAAMPADKHFLIGPNEGHGYWNLPQSVLFFDEVLKGKGSRPAIEDVKVTIDGRDAVVSVAARGAEPGKVEIFFTTSFEIDPDRGPAGPTADTWKWVGVDAKKGADGRYLARWPLPIMRPVNAKGRVTYAGMEAVADPEKLAGVVYAIARATGPTGAMECASPVSTRFSDPPTAVTTRLTGLPALDGAVRITKPQVVAINSAAEGSVATFDGLPVKEVGRGGYILWNWRQKAPSAELKVDDAATPTKRFRVPFTDTVKHGSFVSMFWSYNANGGLTAFTINGVADVLTTTGRTYYGSLRYPGNGGLEELPIQPNDDKEHRLTVLMPACRTGVCHARVSLIAADGSTETVAYRHTADADQLFQFRFTGPVTLRIQMTSQPAHHDQTLIGPSAVFLD